MAEIDRCPCCEREFKNIKDFPRVYIASISSISPDEVPIKIPHFWSEDLTEAVPRLISRYFRDNPDENTFAYRDSYIYERPYNQTKEFKELQQQFPERYSDRSDNRFYNQYKKRFNFAPMLKELLESHLPLTSYLEALKGLEGQEITPSQILPQWEDMEGRFKGILKVPSFGLRPERPLMLSMNDIKKGEEYRVAGINILGHGPNFGSAGGPSLSPLLQIGQIEYEGRVNQLVHA